MNACWQRVGVRVWGPLSRKRQIPGLCQRHRRLSAHVSLESCVNWTKANSDIGNQDRKDRMEVVPCTTRNLDLSFH